MSNTTTCNSLLGSPPSTTVCFNCEKIGSEIVRAKQAITKLHKRMTQAVSKLADFAILGQKILEEDLLEGGLSETLAEGNQSHSLGVKVLEDSRLDITTLERDSLEVAKYAGQMISQDDEHHQDDGSSPLELEEAGEDEHCLYLSQQEWANAGLFVKKVSRVRHFQEVFHLYFCCRELSTFRAL